MLKESLYVLGSTKNEYSDLIKMLKSSFNRLELFYQKEDLLSSIDSKLAESANETGNLFIFFIEHPYLNSISKYINERLNSLNYIIISFYHESCSTLSSQKNLFEFINTSSKDFNEKLLINRLNSEISNRNRISLLQFELKEFYEIGKSLSSQKDTMKLFEMIIDSSISLTSSDAGTIYLVIDKENGNWSSVKNNSYDDKLLKFVIAKNQSMDLKLEASISPIKKESVFGYTIITGQALRIDDAHDLDPELDYRHDSSYDRTTGYVTRSMLSIPLKDHENNTMGVIQLINKKKTKNEKLDYTKKASLNNIICYDYADELIMNSLAGQAAVTLENNLLYRDMQKLLHSYKQQNSQLEFLSRKILKAHEEERKRIAREIHDGPAQSVVNLSLKVELCKKYLQSSNFDKLALELGNLNSHTRAAAKEIRTIIYDLKPSFLDDGLIKALENHFSIFSENTGINVTFHSSGHDHKIEYYLTSTLYRIAQEVFTNISKHAQATNVGVKLTIAEKLITLAITDNGKGFDMSGPSQKKPKIEGGFGLEGIKERVELIKGEINIKSAPGAGTSVIVNIPI